MLVLYSSNLVCHLRVHIIFSPRIFGYFCTNYRCLKHYEHVVNVNMFVLPRHLVCISTVTNKAFLTSGSVTRHISDWGYGNKQNCQIWENENLHEYDTKSLHPQCLTVWAALSLKGIIRPIIIKLLLGYSHSAHHLGMYFWYQWRYLLVLCMRNITPGGSDARVIGTNRRQKWTVYTSEITKNTLKIIYYWHLGTPPGAL